MNMPLSTPVIDIEASGFGLSSYPIEIGLVLANGATYCALVKPHTSWGHWDRGAEKVHGARVHGVLRPAERPAGKD